MNGEKRRPQPTPHQIPAKVSSQSLPPGWPWDEDVDPLRLKGWERRAYYAGFASGFNDGLERERQRPGGYYEGLRDGWRARVEHEQRAWERMRDSICAAGGPFAGVPFSRLAQLRNDCEAAEVARLREQLLGLGGAA
jgi:hypothetical protein